MLGGGDKHAQRSNLHHLVGRGVGCCLSNRSMYPPSPRVGCTNITDLCIGLQLNTCIFEDTLFLQLILIFRFKLMQVIALHQSIYTVCCCISRSRLLSISISISVYYKKPSNWTNNMLFSHSQQGPLRSSLECRLISNVFPDSSPGHR